EIDPSLPQRAEGQDTGHHHGGGHGVGSQDPAPDDRVVASDEGGAIEEEGAPAPKPAGERADSGTVVGAMQSSDAVHTEQAVAVGGVRAMPAVRAQARKLKVDLARVRGTGPDGTVTMADVKRAAAEGSARMGAAGSGAGPAGAAMAATGAAGLAAAAAPAGAGAGAAGRAVSERTALSASGKPMRTQPPSVTASGQPEQLKGVRRNMARVMADAHSKVVPTTLVDDADLHAWVGKQDIT